MKKEIGKLQIIRFRRWSRKAYAAFFSLGKCVAIGCLKKKIADISLKKQPNVCTLFSVCRPETDDEREEEVTDDDRVTFLELLVLKEYCIQPQFVAEKNALFIILVKYYSRMGA